MVPRWHVRLVEAHMHVRSVPVGRAGTKESVQSVCVGGIMGDVFAPGLDKVRVTFACHFLQEGREGGMKALT